jgi:hypothetical protein|tara:strand:- start:1305 stop:1451 length:147 start_codon:yes stop_codon:yes gene_type:complete
MKKKKQKPKSRYAKVLFDKDSPFRQRIVKNKTKYIRKLKHPKKGDTNE